MASVCQKSFGLIFDLNFAILNVWIFKSFQACYLFGKVINGLRAAQIIFHTAEYI